MKLALLEPFARWGYALKYPSMGTGHGRPNDDAFILRNHLMIIKSEVRKSRGEPTTGGDQACGASEPRLGRLGSSSASRLMKSGRDDSIRCHRVAGLDHAKGFERHLLVLLQGHGALRLLYRFRDDDDLEKELSTPSFPAHGRCVVGVIQNSRSLHAAGPVSTATVEEPDASVFRTVMGFSAPTYFQTAGTERRRKWIG